MNTNLYLVWLLISTLFTQSGTCTCLDKYHGGEGSKEWPPSKWGSVWHTTRRIILTVLMSDKISGSHLVVPFSALQSWQNNCNWCAINLYIELPLKKESMNNRLKGGTMRRGIKRGAFWVIYLKSFFLVWKENVFILNWN